VVVAEFVKKSVHSVVLVYNLANCILLYDFDCDLLDELRLHCYAWSYKWACIIIIATLYVIM